MLGTFSPESGIRVRHPLPPPLGIAKTAFCACIPAAWEFRNTSQQNRRTRGSGRAPAGIEVAWQSPRSFAARCSTPTLAAGKSQELTFEKPGLHLASKPDAISTRV